MKDTQVVKLDEKDASIILTVKDDDLDRRVLVDMCFRAIKALGFSFPQDQEEYIELLSDRLH